MKKTDGQGAIARLKSEKKNRHGTHYPTEGTRHGQGLAGRAVGDREWYSHSTRRKEEVFWAQMHGHW